MRLFNARSQQVETFTPRDDTVTVYVCGITPYDTTHLGHIFTYASFDNLIRYLEHTGCTVRYVQNVTDIDDDILRKARETADDWRDVGNRWTRRFIEDLEALNVRPPDHFPRATEFIHQIIETVEALLANGLAYEAGGNVYFDLAAWPDYGKLSRIPRIEMLPIANERGNFPDDPNKQDPLDFVLWQAQQPGEPAWESPWGPGRPGWHIECSTMATVLLGNTIDIHGGGSDLIFPHHESEIAQAEGATGQEPFTRFWLHTAMVRHEGEKMSKSLGNLIMVRDMLQEWSPDGLRLYLAGHHYRQPWSHDPTRLARAEALAAQLRDVMTVRTGEEQDSGITRTATEAMDAFRRAMEDDLDTPTAVGIMTGLAEAIAAGAGRGADVRQGQEQLRKMGRSLGLRLDAPGPEERVRQGWSTFHKKFIEDGETV